MCAESPVRGIADGRVRPSNPGIGGDLETPGMIIQPAQGTLLTSDMHPTCHASSSFNKTNGVVFARHFSLAMGPLTTQSLCLRHSYVIVGALLKPSHYILYSEAQLSSVSSSFLAPYGTIPILPDNTVPDWLAEYSK